MKEKAIERAIAKLRKAGIKISSYTVYPGKGTIKANVTIEIKHEREEATGMRQV